MPPRGQTISAFTTCSLKASSKSFLSDALLRKGRLVFRVQSMEQLQPQGISLPRLGLGTFRMQGDACRAAVEGALELGYRHVDTAEMYGNEDAIGAAIPPSRVAGRELHVTTKVWNENLAPEAIRRAFDASLNKLRLDSVDLYL